MNKFSMKEFEYFNEGIGGIWGITVQSLPTKQILLAMNEQVVFPAASLIKLPILVELYRQVIEENLDLSAICQVRSELKTKGSGILCRLSDHLTVSIKDLAILMMELSDNTAANHLIWLLNKEKINYTMSQMGLTRTVLMLDYIDPTVLDQIPEALATTTPQDMALLLAHLAVEDILTPPRCQEALNLMKRNHNKWRICGQLPLRPDLIVYHKTGTLQGVYSDVGLIRFTKGQYVVSVLTKNVTVPNDPRLPNQAEQAIARFSRWLFDQYDQNLYY